MGYTPKKTAHCPNCGHSFGMHRVYKQDDNTLFIKCVKWMGTNKQGCECNAGFGKVKMNVSFSKELKN